MDFSARVDFVTGGVSGINLDMPKPSTLLVSAFLALRTSPAADRLKL
jgi:hypothetical protein